jgi:hypothetical protein
MTTNIGIDLNSTADVRNSGAPAKPVSSSATSENLVDIDIGTKILVKYQHPSLGRIKYEGVLAEKQIDGSNLESFIQLQDCKQLSSSGIQAQDALRLRGLGFLFAWSPS